MKYKYILFDLDGTITESKLGITKAAQYALKKYNIIVEELEELEKFVGPPLHDSFIDFYGFDRAKAMEAVGYFREYYKDIGIYENVLFDGIEDVLKVLKEEGRVLAIATSKPLIFANRVIDYFNLRSYFQMIVGSNLDGSMTDKSEIIEHVIKTLKIDDLDEVIMIGDRKHDIIGAQKNDVDAIGVSYGAGSIEELKAIKATYIAHSPNDILLIL